MTKLKIIHHNIRGVNNKITVLTLFINKHKPDIITLNETTINNTYIPNYKISSPSPNPGRGVAILYKHDLTIEQLPTITTAEPTTNLHHAILIHTPTESIHIATIYCPRKNPSHEIITRHNKTIITGDFNCRHENFGHETANKDSKLLVQYTEQHKYTKINDNGPTYTNDITGKEDVKDLIFASPKMMETFQYFWVDEDLGSDHRAIIATFSSQPLTHNKPKNRILLYHKADWTAINNSITNEMTKLHLDHTSSTETIDNYTSTLTSVIQTTIIQNVPQIEVKTHSTGIDKTTHLIKEIISETLSKIFNTSILTGQYIDKLKLARTIPIFKKGSRLLVSDYRPISLLSNLNKIMEKLIFKRVYEFLEKYNCFYDLQFGLRSKHSTVHALISITENIRSALDESKYVCGIFVDLQKAFDTVNHDILLNKLNHYGIRGKMNEWFKSYLQGRKQIVTINGADSELRELKHGVPQGSV